MIRREDWIRTALKVLHKEGHQEITPARLARRLEVTRGSFYHHFNSVDDFTDAIVERWETQGIEAGFRDATLKGQTPLGQLKHMTEFIWTRSFHLELAMRAWGLANPRVAGHLARIDTGRRQRVADLMALHFGGNRERGEQTADLLFYSFIGSLCSFPRPSSKQLQQRSEQVIHYLESVQVTPAEQA